MTQYPRAALQYLLKPSAVEGVMVTTRNKQTVQLEFPDPNPPLSLAALRELFKYNHWRKIAKALGVHANGKLADIVDRVVAKWLERGDLVRVVSDPPEKKMALADEAQPEPQPQSDPRFSPAPTSPPKEAACLLPSSPTVSSKVSKPAAYAGSNTTSPRKESPTVSSKVLKPAASAGSNVPGAGNEDNDAVVVRVNGKVFSISKSTLSAADQAEFLVRLVGDTFSKVHPDVARVLSDMADPDRRRDVAKAPACNFPNDSKVSATAALAPQEGGLLHGNCLVPAVPKLQQRSDSATPSADYSDLAKRADFTEEEIKAFEDVGFVFTGTRADQWVQNLSMFRQHVEKYGHCNVTPTTAEQWPGFYDKIRNYRNDWKRIQRGGVGRLLDDNRIKQLEALGFNFNPTGMTFDTSGDATGSAGGKGVESIPSDDLDDPSASLVPSGGTNDPVVPRETTIADRVFIVADLLAKPGALDLFQMDPEEAARVILGDEASPALVAKTIDLLRQGHPGIKFLISSPTPRPKEAAMILLEGALLHDTAMACAEAVFSVPGIQDFISADPSNASLLFLGTDPPFDLVEKVSDYLSNDHFQTILRLSTSSAASHLDKFIAKHIGRAADIAALRDEGRELYLERRYQESVARYSCALRIRARNFAETPMTPRLGQKDLLLAQILGNRAAALLMLGAYDAAVSDCRKGLELIPDTTVWDLKVDSGPALHCRLLGRMGRALLKAGKVDATEEAFDDTIRIADETFARYGRDSVDPKAVNLLDQSIVHASLNKTNARRLRVEKSEINKLCSGLPPNVAAQRYGAQILAHVRTALELAPGDVELHSHTVQLFADMKRWADLALHCERFASACVKFDGLFVGDLTGLNPFPSAPLAQTLKSDHFDLSVWDVVTKAPKLLSEEAVGEAVRRMPMSMLPLYLRALRLEERYAEAQRAASILLGSAREGNLVGCPITLLEREQKKRIRTCTIKDTGDALFRKGQYEEAAAKYAACLLVDAEGEDIATADGSNAGGRLHAVLHCNRAACFMALKLYREASMECTAALRIHAQYMKAKLRRARCLGRLQRYEEAVREYHHWIFLAEAAEQNPQSAVAEYDAACYFDKPSDATPDDIEKARVELNEALKAKNSRAEAEANARARAQRHHQQQQQRSQSNRQQQSETSAPREDNPKGRTPYEVLGVSRDATVAQIKKAYHKMALKHHPDKGGTDEDFLPIKQACDELCARAARTDETN